MNIKVPFGALVIAAAVLHAAESESFQINNEAEFRKCVAPDTRLQKLASDMAFLEGPVWHPAGFLVFSDSPNDEV